ncbi:MAG: hypothetical protein AAF380_01965, partial [Bacteroidota bacterium]
MESIVYGRLIASFFAFLLINLGIGLYQGRSVRTASTFILGRRLTTSALLLTLTGTLIGGEYLTNWFRAGSHWGGGSLFLWVIIISVTGLIATFYIFLRLRQYKNWHTLGNIAFQKTGSHYAQIAIDGIGLVSSIILLSAQLVGLKRMTGLLGFADDHPIAYGIVIFFTVVVIGYASRAGTPGVVSTDVLQMILVLSGTAFITYRVLNLDLAHIRIEGLADLWHQVKTTAGKNPLRYFLKEDPALIRVLFSAPAAGFILFTPAFIKRVAMADDNRQLQHSMLGLIMIFSLFMLMILIGGMGLYVVRGSAVGHNDVYPTLLQIVPHTWMRMVLLIMFLAAVMSTADSVLTAASVVAVSVFNSVGIYKEAITAPTLTSLRVANITLGFLALGLALWFMQHPVIDFVTFARALLGALLPFLLGISLGIKTSKKALLGSVVCFGLLFVGSMILGELVDFSFLDPRWTNPKFPLRLKYGVFLPFITLLSCLAYLVLETVVHGGLKWEKRVRFTEEKPGLL